MYLKLIEKMNHRLMTILVIVLVTMLVIYFNGFLGLLILATSSAIGVLTLDLNVQRTTNMACLMIPVIIYYL